MASKTDSEEVELLMAVGQWPCHGVRVEKAAVLVLVVTGEAGDGVLVKAKPRALAVDLSENAIFVDLLDGTVDPADSYDFVALLQVFDHLLMLLLALLLGAVDEEVEHPDDEDERKQEANDSASAAAGLANEENGIERRKK